MNSLLRHPYPQSNSIRCHNLEFMTHIAMHDKEVEVEFNKVDDVFSSARRNHLYIKYALTHSFVSNSLASVK